MKMEYCYCPPYQTNSHQLFGHPQAYHSVRVVWPGDTATGVVTNNTPEAFTLVTFSQALNPTQYNQWNVEQSPNVYITVDPGKSAFFTWPIATGASYPTSGRIYDSTKTDIGKVEQEISNLQKGARYEFVIQKEEGLPFLRYEMIRVS